MYESRYNPEVVARPTNCPFCKSKVIDTMAKTITVTTFWRCRSCEGTWTIATLKAQHGLSH